MAQPNWICGEHRKTGIRLKLSDIDANHEKLEIAFGHLQFDLTLFALQGLLSIELGNHFSGHFSGHISGHISGHFSGHFSGQFSGLY